MRKKRPLPTRERLHEVMAYCPETGVFTRKIDRKRWKTGETMGTVAGGYLNINIDYVVYRAHRLAWRYMTGEDPTLGIDHINGEPLDNRWVNLRLATQAQNMMNKRVQSNNTTGLKGVYRYKEKFHARIMLNGKARFLGTYETKEEAKAAYNAAALVMHGEYANFG